LVDEKSRIRQIEARIEAIESKLTGLANQLSTERETLKALSKVQTETKLAVKKIGGLHNQAESLYETTDARAKTHAFFGTFHGAADQVIRTAETLSLLAETYPDLGSSLRKDKAKDIITKCNDIKQKLDGKKSTFIESLNNFS